MTNKQAGSVTLCVPQFYDIRIEPLDDDKSRIVYIEMFHPDSEGAKKDVLKRTLAKVALMIPFSCVKIHHGRGRWRGWRGYRLVAEAKTSVILAMMAGEFLLVSPLSDLTLANLLLKSVHVGART